MMLLPRRRAWIGPVNVDLRCMIIVYIFLGVPSNFCRTIHVNMLTRRRVSLNLPPYLSSGGQFSSKEVKETKTIAKLRIHVERAIRRIKENHIYDTPIPLSLLGTVNQLWTVTCLLVNFQGPLILKSNSS